LEFAVKDKWLEHKGTDTRFEESHPSFGCITLNYVSGGNVLFGSNVKHNHFMGISISEAKRIVDGSSEYLLPGKEIVRIAMTQSQYAEMISSPNRMSGTACTLERTIVDKGQPWETSSGCRPKVPSPEPFTDRFKDIVNERIDKISSHIKTAKDMIDNLFTGTVKPTKANLKELQGALYTAQMNCDNNLPYIVEELEEGIEKRMATATTEFESYIDFSMAAKGLSALRSEAPQLINSGVKSLPAGE
jgi:hypothetical protein